ncbi:hypothetical protein SETIT_9G516000v2 [Setaria italica]|uniref:Bowman-Birk serine protease inhibitors family domain-containing protein n=1 Tax=Setaria italica TaxID=4555 RepID=A0A368SV22_SETIT|nr:hypothetical protein SETIT_9G516000v2 [Setaria italica]
MNTRNIRGVLVSTMTVIMLLFLLPNAGTARSHAYSIMRFGGVDGSKVALVFCGRVRCEPKHLCYCCMTEKPGPLCYDTLDECRAVCPSCNPTCPP